MHEIGFPTFDKNEYGYGTVLVFESGYGKTAVWISDDFADVDRGTQYIKDNILPGTTVEHYYVKHWFDREIVSTYPVNDERFNQTRWVVESFLEGIRVAYPRVITNEEASKLVVPVIQNE